ncbi:glycosyl transferase [Streptomyces viridiviolaceus]|uniref:Activator-dependent family glycosyltransferase n=1 Tax=Streptomyces viridiviolaceus TaxID=68282 RepID=A0ABW2DX06_9ACTN|nr:activator-dependent family glycosyltransferase [Streptomyces viridiviolaceus]GHB16561.1 glycosyl transferase [Streptomyces viridiviolaceus]
MRVLLTAFAQDAHLNAVVPPAWALRTAGHEVRVASQPAAVDGITRAGLTAVPVGEDHRMDDVIRTVGPGMLMHHLDRDYLENRPERLSVDYLRASNAMLTATFYSQINNDSMIDELVEYARFWKPDLVLWEPFTFAGAVAAKATGAAHARLLGFPDLFANTHLTLRRRQSELPEELRDDPLEEWLAYTLDRHGAAFDPETVTGQWSVDQMPPGVRMELGLPTVPMRYVPYNGPGPAVVPDWLRRPPRRRRVCLTLGLTIRDTEFPNAVDVDEVFASLAELDVEVVATLSEKELAQVSRVPDNTRVVDHVALLALLPSCSAIVHHGGAGTFATATAYGVPQVALGWMWDAIYRAQRIEELGAGLHLHSEGLSVEVLRDKLVRVLDEPGFRAGAQRLRRAVLSTPAPNEVVPVIEKLTARHRSGTVAR